MRPLMVAVLLVPLVGGTLHAQDGAGGGGGGKYTAPPDSGGQTPVPEDEKAGGSGEAAAPDRRARNTAGGKSTSAGGPAARGGAGRGGSARGGAPGGAGKHPDFGASSEGWEPWWASNQDGLLALKSRLLTVGNQSGVAGQLTGRGRPDTSGRSRRPTAEAIETDVLPALREIIRTADDGEVLAAALIALARASRGRAAYGVLTTAGPLLAHDELTVQAAAALALGLSGSGAAVPMLDALAHDAAEGRALVGGDSVPDSVRAAAALALGLVDDPDVSAPLIDLVGATPDAQRDIKVAAIVALGLTPPDATGAAGTFLLHELADRRLDPAIACFIPTALGKLGHAEAVAPLLQALLDRDTDNLVRQSAAIGLGRLADIQQAEVISALRQCIEEGKDEQTRHFCLVSLARIGIRSAEEGGGAGDTEGRQADLAKVLANEISRPSHSDHRSWAALAGALYAQASAGSRPLLLERVQEAWKEEKDPAFRSAFALALGLLRADAMAPALLEDFQRSKDLELKGSTAVALGFLSFTGAAEALRRESALETAPPAYRLQVATGLALLQDTEAVKVLVGLLDSTEAQSVSAATASALGRIGDAEALAPLRRLALDTSRDASVRALACAALGELCERTDLPWHARVTADDNYAAGGPVPCGDQAGH